LIHFGAGKDDKEDYYYIRIETSTASALGVGNQSAQNAGYAVSTQAAAQDALDAVDAAIVSKDRIRASLGATQSRLEGTLTNLQVQAENLQGAEAQIRDVDVSTEMTEFVRQQIIAQSATAMLAQANVMPRLALQLLGG
ncbi:MAG: flagellin, partial [Desulfovibrionaceae bacterium]|nr:flagellin [Desulfovibrionaceae bacterium]